LNLQTKTSEYFERWRVSSWSAHGLVRVTIPSKRRDGSVLKRVCWRCNRRCTLW
jgi:hypothetical protein